MSTARGLPNRISAAASTIRVLPDPVGPKNKRFATGRPGDAIRLLKPSIKRCQSKLGPGHRVTLGALNKLSLAYEAIGALTQAVEAAGELVNKLRNLIDVCAVKSPGFGDRRKAMMGDMATLTGGTFISEDLGLKLENIELDQLGSAKRVVISKDNTLIVEGGGS